MSIFGPFGAWLPHWRSQMCTFQYIIFFNAGHSARSGSLRFQEAALIMPSGPLLSGSTKVTVPPRWLKLSFIKHWNHCSRAHFCRNHITVHTYLSLLEALSENANKIGLDFRMFPGSFVSRLDPRSTQRRLTSGTYVARARVPLLRRYISKIS